MRFQLHCYTNVLYPPKTKTKTKIKNKKQNKTQQNKKNIIRAKVEHVFVHLDATLY